MKKRMILTILATLMILTLVSAAAWAAGSISLDADKYQPESLITVEVSGITQEMFDDAAYVSIYAEGAEHNDYGEFHYPEVGSSSLTFNAPAEPGKYEMRLYREDYVYTDASFVTSVAFSVEGAVSSVAEETEATPEPEPEATDATTPEPTEPEADEVVAAPAAPVNPNRTAAKDKVVLNVAIRDFKADGVLFEGDINSDAGLVQSALGVDHKPVYNLAKWQELYGASVSQGMLNSFFNDASGVNMTTKKVLTLNADAQGYYIIDSAVDQMGAAADGYFPIDNELFGNEGNEHNYHFSTELHAVFQYQPGDYFEFVGDDDLWAFFDGKLAVDLGGVHSADSAEVSIDELVASGVLNIKPGDYVSFDMFHMERHLTESNMYVKTNINFVNFNNSDWATYELFTAYENDLIPDRLVEEALTLPVYRDEFAAVAVKLYEAMSGKDAAVGTNPFSDTSDPEVLKAYNLGIVNGTSATTFSPRAKLTRQEAATMLTRVYKAVKLSGWTLQTDSQFTLDYVKPAAFADDSNIDAWAKDSVYFMAANDVIKGLGDNKFAPKNMTSQEEAAGYANSTREQALVISVRSFMNL